MVHVLAGQKGSGKTQIMMDLANKELKNVQGNVVFIKNNHRDTRNVDFAIRVICMDDYPAITNIDGYIGFLYGIYSANHDTECVFIDGLMKHAEITLDTMPTFLNKLQQISVDTGIEFYVSISAERKELTEPVYNRVIFVE